MKFVIFTTPTGSSNNWVKDLYLGGPAMDEETREKAQEHAPFNWVNLNRISLDRDIEMFKARQRARLTVLDLTHADKRFLKSLKIAV